MNLIRSHILEFTLNPSINKESLSFFFTNVRQVIEKENLNSKYSKIHFFCNWLLHPELTRKNTTESILKEMQEVIVEHLNEKTEIEIELSKKLNLPKLKQELILFLKYINIEIGFIKLKHYWKMFESILLHLLLEKPVLFDRIPELKTNENTNYNFKGFRLINHENTICYELLSDELEELNSRIVIALARF